MQEMLSQLNIWKTNTEPDETKSNNTQSKNNKIKYMLLEVKREKKFRNNKITEKMILCQNLQ